MTEPVSSTPHAYRARWIVPVLGEPIEDGVVTVVDGLVTHLGRHSDAPLTDLGDVVLLPGLVNVHTHLEFSDLPQPLGQPGQVFPHWIREVIALRRGRNVDPRPVVELGLHESRQAGVAVVGEIATGTTWDPSLVPPLDTTVFHETICLQPERFADVLSMVDAFLTTRAVNAVWRAGLSPHAPYTVHPRLLVELVERACRHRLPVAMHLAESREELQLLAHGSGPFRELLDGVGIAWPQAELAEYRRPLDYLRVLAAAPRALVVHGNYLTTEEIAFLAARREQMSIVYCPRTHAYFRHERYPLVELLASGAAVALGTDGRGSNPDLSLLAELRHVTREYPQLSPQQVLALGTIAGARALGLDDRYGAIAPGFRAQWCVIPTLHNDPWDAVLHGTQPPRCADGVGLALLAPPYDA